MSKQTAKMTSVDKLVDIACDGLSGRNWYSDATQQIDYVSWLEGWDRNEFAGVLATTSPRCSVLRNIRLALHFMKHRDIRVVPMRGIRTSVLRFLDGKGIAGQKTSSFYANLLGCPNSVTLDVWMAYALGIEQTDFNRVGDRQKATDRVVAVGRVMGISPAQAQACIWVGYQRRIGYNPAPFSIGREYFAARANGWEITGCSISRD